MHTPEWADWSKTIFVAHKWHQRAEVDSYFKCLGRFNEAGLAGIKEGTKYLKGTPYLAIDTPDPGRSHHR